MRVRYFVLLLAPLFLFAADGEGKTDIVPRVINFIIFAAILYYFISKPIKEFFVGRTDNIAGKLSEIQDRLKSLKDEKDSALNRVKEADLRAEEIIKTAKIEAKIAEDRVAKELEEDLQNLKKSQRDLMEIEQKKMSKSVVSEVVEEIFNSKDTELKSEDFLNIIKRKVA